MSNIYVTEPPYSGRVILETNKGDIEVELFAKECPQTCKNFIALALEGYYDNIIWHRLVPDFIIQTGDPTGTGLGGESFFGESFSDEFHQRLRFNRRGLLGMANASQPNTNDSQFFLTLANTPELQARHTMFGRISNNTIYNLVNLAESAGEIGEDDRPVFPPKLRTIRVLENPFEGEIKLRITKEEREQMKRNKREAAKQKMERESAGLGDKKKKKNTSLLSFGQEEDVQDGQVFEGPKSSHDLLKNDKRLRKEAAVREAAVPVFDAAELGQMREEREEKRKRKEIEEEKAVALSDLRSEKKTKQPSSADKIAELEASIRGLSKQDTSEEVTKGKKSGKGKDLLQEYRDKYKKAGPSSKPSKKKDEETASLLLSFQKRLRDGKEVKLQQKAKETAEEVPEDLREYGASDEEDDADWRSHKFDFGGKAVAQDGHDNDEYVTLDPRDTASSKAALLGFGGSEGARRAKEDKARDGRRGRDWVDSRESREGQKRPEKGNGHRSERDNTRGKREDEQARPRSNVERW